MGRLFLVLLAFRMSIAVIPPCRVGGVMLVEFSRFLEIMAFAGNAEHADGHEKQ